MPSPPTTYAKRNKKWLTQEVMNLVGIDLDGDGIIDALNVNLLGAQLQFPTEVEIANDIGNPVPVTIVSGAGTQTSFVKYGKQSAVPNGTLTTILTHTVVTTDLYLTGFIMTGEIDAEVGLYINTARAIPGRTSEQDRNLMLHFPSALKMAVGTILDLKIEHFYNGKVSDFEAALIGYY